jgi:hypothetical protein
MEPIVHGLRRQYSGCFEYERVNFHVDSEWHHLIGPLATPEFALLDDSGQVIQRWFGVTEQEQFDELLRPLCKK